MGNNSVITGVLVDEGTTTYSFTQVCHTYHVSESELMDLLEHGLFHEITSSVKPVNFNLQMVKRIRSARRLQEDLGVNLPGVVLALELRDELDRLRNELTILRRHLSGGDA